MILAHRRPTCQTPTFRRIRSRLRFDGDFLALTFPTAVNSRLDCADLAETKSSHAILSALHWASITDSQDPRRKSRVDNVKPTTPPLAIFSNPFVGRQSPAAMTRASNRKRI